ncbi:hypothetical protein Lepto7375DRAFT_1136 [Leptolyngbya sp. PCC 7375]|nr:hypothetical protein Lepto7375DRAFT_1136 [Leptolyngbya sp. PCC 7375]
MAEEFIYRVHPAIGLARVGNSKEFYLGPETIAGLPIPGCQANTTGGLPIKPDTESETITSRDLRDTQGALKRQAARFRIYQYTTQDQDKYPSGAGTEITIGSTINGQKVVDMIWTVHLANKKANNYVLENPRLGTFNKIIDGYKEGGLPPLRNPDEGPEASSFDRLRKLVIDPGPRAIKGTDTDAIHFDKCTTASFGPGNSEIRSLPDYPTSFPSDSFDRLYSPVGDIDTLGELRTDSHGRLLVLAAYGRACAWYPDNDQGASPYALSHDVDNNGWFDDTSDGPVSVVLVLADGSTQSVHGAWAVATDPAYAPQILNVVSLWDDIYNSWVQEPALAIAPQLFANGEFNPNYQPSFEDEINPIFQAASLQMWTTNLPQRAIRAHHAVGEIKASDKPSETILAGLAFIRNPNNPSESGVGAPLMPFHLGDQGQALLSPTFTQYFFLSQWDKEQFVPGANALTALGPGEYLDKAILMNCLGGRFSPGIDMTFIVRQPEVYQTDWRETGAGPFRLKAKPLAYTEATTAQPFLSEGYVPYHSASDGLEPGDPSKFLANPWHTDYNSCATHQTAPNPPSPLMNQPSSTLYWSWPSQRPVAVYPAADVNSDHQLPENARYSMRGKGTQSTNPENQGRYQNRLDILPNWHRLGVVIQGSAIDSGTYSQEHYLEVASQLDQPIDSIAPPWPQNATEASATYAPTFLDQDESG